MKLNRYRRMMHIVLIVLIATCFGGCDGTPIAQDLDQRQATEIVAVLHEQGISAFAERESGGKGRYHVEVRRADYSQAVTILHDRNLPGERRASFNELVAQSGLIPNSRELDALKVDRALATEVEEMLQNHPDVAAARAIVRLNFLRDQQEPAVSLVIQERSGRSVRKDDIVAAISKIVPGVRPESVSILVSAVNEPGQTALTEGARNIEGKVVRIPLTPFLYFWRVPEDEYAQIAGVLVGFLVIVGIVGAFMGYWFGVYQHSREYFDTSLPEVISPRAIRPMRVRPEVETDEELKGE
ncbi:MAG: hypothetical protein K1X79_11755 [Oligoflexia bacterium]|nr:hypothetical protein [Oligoflexia bacterium]